MTALGQGVAGERDSFLLQSAWREEQVLALLVRGEGETLPLVPRDEFGRSDE
jgi:hypothetical protein